MDGKHTIFGKVVGGLDTLSNFEKVEVDNKDRPIEDITIQSTTVFVDPFTEIDEELASERRKETERLNQEKAEASRSKKAKVKTEVLKVYKEGIGKYINPKRKAEEDTPSALLFGDKSKKKPSGCEFKNFGNW